MAPGRQADLLADRPTGFQPSGDVAQPVQQAIEGVLLLVQERAVTLSVSLQSETVFVDG
jgi:hypothetical protein